MKEYTILLACSKREAEELQRRIKGYIVEVTDFCDLIPEEGTVFVNITGRNVHRVTEQVDTIIKNLLSKENATS